MTPDRRDMFWTLITLIFLVAAIWRFVVGVLVHETAVVNTGLNLLMLALVTQVLQILRRSAS